MFFSEFTPARLLLALFLVGHAACLSAFSPVVAETNQQSCVAVTSDIRGNLLCSSQGETGVLTLEVEPGSFYRFTEAIVYQEDQPLENGEATGANDAYVGSQFEYEVEVSQITMRRSLYGRDLEIPYAYAGFHSKTYRKVWGIDQTDLQGYGTLFVPEGDVDTVFFPTVRLDNIVTVSSPYEVGEIVNLPPEFGGFFQDLIKAVQDASSLLEARYMIWGEADFEFVVDDDGNQRFVLQGNRAEACRVLLFDDDITSLVGPISGRAFFSAPWVTSAAREACGGGTCGGNFNCNIDLCCGSLPGQQSAELAELNKCLDPSYCKERATVCDMNEVYYSQYKIPSYRDAKGDFNERVYDDDNDDDSCGDDDNENPDDACNFSLCGNELTDSEKYYIAQDLCTCPHVDLSGDAPPSGSLDFSDCTTTSCYANGAISAGNAATSLDINLTSKRGQNSGRFGPEDAPDDDDDDEQNIFHSTSLSGVGDGSKTCSGCDREKRSFCPEGCRNKSMQDLLAKEDGKTHPACRMLRGMAGRMDYVYVAVDDFGSNGDNDDEDNYGMISPTCVQECLDTKDCNPSLVCVDRERPPLYDDDYEDALAPGPYRVNYVYPKIPGQDSELLTMHPNAGGVWYNGEDNIRAVPPNDDTFGSVDDDHYCSVYGMNDQGSADDFGTWVAECPPAFCIPSGDFQPDGRFLLGIDDDSDINPNFLCPSDFFGAGATADDVRRLCHRPYPRYPDDEDPDPTQSDGSNPDGLHPADPYDYDPKPATVCPLTLWDRVPLLAVDQRRYVDTQADYRVAAFTTAEAFALYGPFCHAYYMDAFGTPQFQVAVTRRDLSSALSAQTVVVSPYSEEAEDGSESTSFYGISDDGTMLVRIRGVSSITTGAVLGKELNDMLVICNATYDGLAGAPNVPYRMAGATNDPRVTARSPWNTIVQGVSYFFEGFLQTVYGHGVAVLNTEFVALLPIPQVLWSVPDAYDTRDFNSANDLVAAADTVSIKKGSGWYTVPRRLQPTYGEGFRQIGMKADAFSNDAIAARACANERYAAVPGMIPGYDWTLQQHNVDFDKNVDAAFNLRTQETGGKRSNNFGTYTRYLRDFVLKESTPMIVFSRMMEYMSLPTCSQVVAKLSEFDHLPPGFLRDAGEGPCDLPTMWPHGSSFYFKDDTVNTDDTRITVEIAQVDAVFTGTANVVQLGTFVDDPAPICAVAENSVDGQVTVSVQNLGKFTSDFLVTGECDEGVAVTSSQARALDGYQTGQFSLLLSHTNTDPFGSNVRSNDTTLERFTCQLYLTNPGDPDPTDGNFDQVTLSNCVITDDQPAGVTGDIPEGVGDTCEEFGTGCAAAPGTGGPTVDAANQYNWALITTTLLLLFLLSAVVCLWCSESFASNQDKAYQVARIQKEINAQKRKDQ